MRFKTFVAVIFAFCVLFPVSASLSAENVPETQNAPIAFPLSDKHEFPSVVEGTDVIHDFIIQNKGTAPLKIKKVTAG